MCDQWADGSLQVNAKSLWFQKTVGEGEGETKEFPLQWFLGTFMEETRVSLDLVTNRVFGDLESW